ncbi:efflux RND transporter permease subunit [Thermosynechococcus vestitus]|uniref:AcrB/AcrD/AcrF family protein n=1 Tax=Thermosynechococcus vestitus (strain NIES-2133 / IAM M-273 / BP-1) TaxID=197221 RepID=Q8DJR3_THEVB|nr:efflux RND transporter permease subunit [Thermosynechococcus vestitus]BAC08711.1 AcrB/AcrD/AcrF family protein [Thermosynechococcus vestitus BP-1]
MTSPPFSFSRLAVTRHIGTLMLTLTVIVLAVFTLLRLQVDLLPGITYPRIGVRLDIPGVVPSVAVEEVTKPLEEALSRTEGVVQVYSQTREGQVSIDLFFEPGGDVDQALNEATAAFNRARSTLPDMIESPRLFKFDPSQLPVYEFALTSETLSGRKLRVFADEDLDRELSIVPGVAGVDVSGGTTEEVRILVDLDRLQATGVGLNQILTALSDRNQDVSGGRIRGQSAEPLTRTVGRFHNLSEIEDVVLTGTNGQRVYLRDVAQVVDGSAEQRVFVTLNGQPAVKVSIFKQPTANTVEVADGIKRRLAELQAANLVPRDVQMIPVLDESVYIRNSLNNVITAGLTGTLLAAIAVLLFLGSVRQTLIIVLAIPLSTMAAMLLMGLFNFSLNVFSLGGLALGVGIVVDNAIVMLETLADIDPQQMSQEQYLEEMKRRSQGIESALVASTLTNLVAILPFLLLGGLLALLFNELILTISFAVAASLLVALTVVPALASRLLAVRVQNRLRQVALIRLFNEKFLWLRGRYEWALGQVLRARWLVVGLAIALLGGSSWLLAQEIPQELLPRINTGQVNLTAIFPPGTPLPQSRRVMAAVDEVLMAQPGTKAVFTTTGGALFGTNTIANPLRANSTIILRHGVNVDRYITEATTALDQLNLVGVRLRLRPGQVRGIILTNSPVRGADVDVILRGSDEETLSRFGRQVLRVLDEKATLVRFRPDADPRQPEIQILPDWERVSELGLNTLNLGQTIQTALTGFVPTRLQRGDRLVDIRVQLSSESIQNPADLATIPLFSANNRPLRLGDVAHIEPSQAPAEIQRINRQQVFILAGNLVEGASLSAALAEINAIVRALEFPPGVSLMPSTAAQANQQLQQALGVLGGLAAFLVFVVMAVQYNSLLDPLVIMFTIPLALAGGIWGLYLTRTAIGATVIVGAILLVGIVVNNAIIMVELANEIYQQEGCSRSQAIRKAAPARLRPIMMTTITTVVGMFPLALGLGEGSEFLQPLGIVVFSGLAVATLLTLFLIPCFYVILHGFERTGHRRLPAPLPAPAVPPTGASPEELQEH